ncbi:BON domain-containing protein [Leptolyngbya sp. CCNP1308]|uniref:BON domain-containing protein n=1 Tax=Leptolyngbya sp. CCNP1308 TaxID=3110255 RepID=UPI002B1FC1EE|nr:BON domain-containing protein [Leptolyngbya sp. CCNP1308]MEA5451713.1 BON domain-containing protein [Leptolyngbya sp. CCNP1308]
MKSLNLLAKGSALFAIALFGLAACNQPNTAQTEPTTPGAPAAQDAPANQTLSADDTADRVEDALDNHETLGSFDLDADDEGETIVLEGTVDQAEQSTLAEDVARQTAPDFTIVNRINVR